MKAKIFGAISLLAITAACGISQEEHDKALADQKATLQAEMAKMQASHESEIDKKNNGIRALESEVKRLGGNLSEIAAKAEGLQDVLQSTESQLAASQEELAQLRKQREQLEKASAAFRAVAERLKSMIDAGTLQVGTRKGRMILKLPDNILFPSGRKDLKKGGREALQEVAKVLKDVEDRDFIITGHTDNVPVRRGGRFKSNWELSTARALEVVKLMIKNGVPPERLGAAGYAEFDPVGDNETKEGRAQNRRLEIVLMPKIDELPNLPDFRSNPSDDGGKDADDKPQAAASE